MVRRGSITSPSKSKLARNWRAPSICGNFSAKSRFTEPALSHPRASKRHSGGYSLDLGDCNELQAVRGEPTQFWSDVVIEEGTAAPSDFAPRPASPRTAAQTRPPSDLANANSVVGWPAFVVHARARMPDRADAEAPITDGFAYLSDSLLAAAVPPRDRATALTLRHVKLHIWVRMACSTDDAAEQCRAQMPSQAQKQLSE
jgi:hypothetical protein